MVIYGHICHKMAIYCHNMLCHSHNIAIYGHVIAIYGHDYIAWPCMAMCYFRICGARASHCERTLHSRAGSSRPCTRPIHRSLSKFSPRSAQIPAHQKRWLGLTLGSCLTHILTVYRLPCLSNGMSSPVTRSLSCPSFWPRKRSKPMSAHPEMESSGLWTSAT